MLKQGLLHLDEVLKHLEPLHKPLEPPGGSVLLHELVSAPVLAEATSNPQVCVLLSSRQWGGGILDPNHQYFPSKIEPNYFLGS